MSRVLVSRNFPETIIKMVSDAGIKMEIWKEEQPIGYDLMKEKSKDIDGILCTLTEKIDEEFIKSSKSLKVISTMSVGFDHINLKAAKERNIRIGYTPGVLTETTAELAVALLLLVSRRLYEGINVVKNNQWNAWSPFWMCGKELNESTVGIIGFGAIGQAIAKRLSAFGVQNFYASGSGRPKSKSELKINDTTRARDVSLPELLHKSDFVIVSCALNDYTKQMINKSVFSQMKTDAILINISRGGVVNQDDLYDALFTKRIGAAGLDVCTPEPMSGDHKLLTLPNCFVLPHIGSASFQTREKMANISVINLINGLQGKEMVAEVNY